jgi:hypothetical protein
VVPVLADCRQQRPVDHELTAASGAVVIGQILSGLGGVGKTQLAAALAQHLWETGGVDLLVWVTASSRAAVVAEYAAAYGRISGVEGLEATRAAERFLAWLAEGHGRRWLIVLDDLADPNDLAGLWPPTADRGRTVVTTRRRDAALLAGRQVIYVDVFTPAQAFDYLRAKLAGSGRGLDGAPGLAADLGFLPLALSQAAAYILDRGPTMTCDCYRRLLADRRRQLADLAPAALPDAYQSTVAATWSLSIERADRQAPAGLARLIIEMAALLDPNGIPVALFGTRAVGACCGTLAGRPVDANDAADALSLLRAFSLVAIDERTDVVTVHNLVQRAVREATAPDVRTDLAVAVADGLRELWPPFERDIGHAQLLRANATALIGNADECLWGGAEGVHPLIAAVGTSLGVTGLVTEAEAYFQDLHATAERRLGPEHVSALSIRHDLATWHGATGDPAGAVSAHRALLPDLVRVLGPDHLITLSARNELAYWQAEDGDPAGAVAAFARTLNDCRRLLGADDPFTLKTRHHLAWWRGVAGEPDAAAVAYSELIGDYERALGPDHPDVLLARNNGAWWQGHAGDPVGAVEAYRMLVRDYMRVLGPDNPDTLIARHNHAVWTDRAGDAIGAAAAFADLLRDCLQVLGREHPHTGLVRRNLLRLAPPD